MKRIYFMIIIMILFLFDPFCSLWAGIFLHNTLQIHLHILLYCTFPASNFSNNYSSISNVYRVKHSCVKLIENRDVVRRNKIYNCVSGLTEISTSGQLITTSKNKTINNIKEPRNCTRVMTYYVLTDWVMTCID